MTARLKLRTGEVIELEHGVFTPMDEVVSSRVGPLMEAADQASKFQQTVPEDFAITLEMGATLGFWTILELTRGPEVEGTVY